MNSKQQQDLKKAQDDWNRDRQDFLMNMPAESTAKPVSDVKATGAEKLIESAQEACMLIIGAYEGYRWEGGDLQRTASDMFEYAKAGYEVSKAKPVSEDVGLDSAWPLSEVLGKLIEASEILLDNKNYDGHGWEEISHAVKVAKEYHTVLKSGYAAAPAKGMRFKNLVLHDTICGDMENIESLDDARKFVIDNYTEGNEMHIDFASFDIYEKVGSVYVEEKDGVATGIKAEYIDKSSSDSEAGDAVEFAEWIGNEVLDFDGKGNWFTPDLKKQDDKKYSVVYGNPKTTTELYRQFKKQ